MNEYDLFKSIGEVDEKLMRRYDPETARRARRSSRRVRLIVDLILVLLIVGLFVWLLLRGSAAERRVNAETALSESISPTKPPAPTHDPDAPDQLKGPLLSELLAQPTEEPILPAEGEPLLEILYFPEDLPGCFLPDRVSSYRGTLTEPLSVWDVFNDAELQQAAAAACRGGGVPDEQTLADLAWTLADHLPECEELHEVGTGSLQVDWFPAEASLYSGQIWEIEFMPVSMEPTMREIAEQKRNGKQLLFFYDGEAAYVYVSAADGHVIAIENNGRRFLPGIVRNGAVPAT